jgi:hypothetical protein
MVFSGAADNLNRRMLYHLLVTSKGNQSNWGAFPSCADGAKGVKC